METTLRNFTDEMVSKNETCERRFFKFTLLNFSILQTLKDIGTAKDSKSLSHTVVEQCHTSLGQ